MTIFHVFKEYEVGGRMDLICTTRDPDLAEQFRAAVDDPEHHAWGVIRELRAAPRVWRGTGQAAA